VIGRERQQTVAPLVKHLEFRRLIDYSRKYVNE
jgi:hypothetical protein